MDAASEPLDCPITALGGTEDPAVSAAMLAGWRERTAARFAQHAFPGDHFYLNEAREAVVAAILGELAKTG